MLGGRTVVAEPDLASQLFVPDTFSYRWGWCTSELNSPANLIRVRVRNLSHHIFWIAVVDEEIQRRIDHLDAARPGIKVESGGTMF